MISLNLFYKEPSKRFPYKTKRYNAGRPKTILTIKVDITFLVKIHFFIAIIVFAAVKISKNLHTDNPAESAEVFQSRNVLIYSRDVSLLATLKIGSTNTTASDIRNGPDGSLLIHRGPHSPLPHITATRAYTVNGPVIGSTETQLL